MKLLLALTTFALLYRLHLAQEFLDSWFNPPRSLRRKIDLTIKEYDLWTGLGKFIPIGGNVEPTALLRFCKCENPRGKRSFMKIVKRQGPDSKSGQKRIRREWRRMTAEMKRSFKKHFLELSVKKAGEEKSKLQLLADWHRNAEAPAAHGGNAFLPWHREFLFRLENYLIDAGYDYGLPYWNSGLEYGLIHPGDSAIFTTSELGVRHGVLGDPFKNIHLSKDCIDGNHKVVRREDNEDRTLLFHRQKKDNLDMTANYTTFRKDLELIHNAVHRFIGGTMLSASCTGFEPMFYMHHAYIDYVWEEYRQKQTPFKRENDFPKGDNDGEHSRHTTMLPFLNMDNIDGMKNQYTDQYYEYEKSPDKCTQTKGCKSKLLWCNNRLCQAKARKGGACDTNLRPVQCYCPKLKRPVCEKGTCICKPHSA